MDQQREIAKSVEQILHDVEITEEMKKLWLTKIEKLGTDILSSSLSFLDNAAEETVLGKDFNVSTMRNQCRECLETVGDADKGIA